MNLIVQPGDGITPILAAVKRAKTSIDISIFRFDLPELQKALEQAVLRGVKVHALIAHQGAGEGKKLRKLELDLLAAGAMVSRTNDDLVRYHDKVLIIDRSLVFILAFNWTRVDVKSRSLGLMTRNAKLLHGAIALFEADSTRQPYGAKLTDRLIVSPENARAALGKFIKGTKKELLVYEMKISDKAMIGLLHDRRKAGVKIRIIGKVANRAEGLKAKRMPGLRLHLRGMLRDGSELFVGSQSLRTLELDKRREVGVIVKDRSAARRYRELFEEDWKKATA